MAVTAIESVAGLGRLWSLSQIRARAHYLKLSSFGPAKVVLAAFSGSAKDNTR
jgi:hypothetical protein